ncbi:LOW QUALITY PROTEIN: ankyrin-2, partial [Oncorhynchus kisutch]|uniref:LOW QUALITY PROTEIN: ankyrin-2 n=1 Tax=Oncorhynchus kisutch TaxID=8019 RepID=UPI0012DCECB1
RIHSSTCISQVWKPGGGKTPPAAESYAWDDAGKNGLTPLHVAAHYDNQQVALRCLTKGRRPTPPPSPLCSQNGYTPLHIAAKKNQTSVASSLLQYGAETNVLTKQGVTPLHLASQEGHSDMTSLLLGKGAHVNTPTKSGLTPLHLTAQEDRVNAAEVLAKRDANLDQQTKLGYTPLIVACHYGNVKMVNFLLQQGASVNAKTKNGYTPLHQAAQQGHTHIINVLLQHGATPNTTTANGNTALSIARRLGYISVVDTLKVVTEEVITTTTTVTSEKHKMNVPETMTEILDVSDEEGEDTMTGDGGEYLRAEDLRELGDDSLPGQYLDGFNYMSHNLDRSHQTPVHQRDGVLIEDMITSHQVSSLSRENEKDSFRLSWGAEHLDNVVLSSSLLHSGQSSPCLDHDNSSFLVSFMVDARGGAMRGCRHNGLRIIVPPRKCSAPTRVTCRLVKRHRLASMPPMVEGEGLAGRIIEVGPTGAQFLGKLHLPTAPPPLNEGESLVSRILQLGPPGTKFLGPVIVEIPHFAALRGTERELVILRSEMGESWREHHCEHTEEELNQILNGMDEELDSPEELEKKRICRIVTRDFPQYFAVVSRIKQDSQLIGPEGAVLSSTLVPQVQAVFPEGALTKKIRVGLQAQPISVDLVKRILGNKATFSPIVTLEPRRRKFHKPITMTIPVPKSSTNDGTGNVFGGDTPTLRLLCSITGGTTPAQWEDITGSTPLTFINQCVSFTTNVSARFWLIDCRQTQEAVSFSTQLYREIICVPYMAKFVIFAKTLDPIEARLRCFCMTDDKMDKTLEQQENFTEVARSRDVEVLEGKPIFADCFGNLVPLTKSGQHHVFSFYAFKENRLALFIKIRDCAQEPCGRLSFTKEPRTYRSLTHKAICNLNITLPTYCKESDSDLDADDESDKSDKKYDETESTDTYTLPTNQVLDPAMLASPDLLSEVSDMKHDLIKMSAILTTEQTEHPSPSDRGRGGGGRGGGRTGMEEEPGEPFEIMEQVKEDLEKVGDILRGGDTRFTNNKEKVLQMSKMEDKELVILSQTKAKAMTPSDVQEPVLQEVNIQRKTSPTITKEVRDMSGMVSHLSGGVNQHLEERFGVTSYPLQDIIVQERLDQVVLKREGKRHPPEIKKPIRKKLRDRERSGCSSSEGELERMSSEESLDGDVVLGEARQEVVPGSEPGVIPGSEPVVVPGSEPVVVPGSEPGVVPGSMPGVVPGSMPGVVPGSEPVVIPRSMPGVVPGSEPVVVPRSMPGVVPGSEPVVVPRSMPGVVSGSGPGVGPRTEFKPTATLDWDVVLGESGLGSGSETWSGPSGPTPAMEPPVSPLVVETPIGSIKDRVRALQKKVEEEEEGEDGRKRKPTQAPVPQNTTFFTITKETGEPQMPDLPKLPRSLKSPRSQTERLEETMSVRELMKAFQTGQDPSKNKTGLFEHKAMTSSTTSTSSSEAVIYSETYRAENSPTEHTPAETPTSTILCSHSDVLALHYKGVDDEPNLILVRDHSEDSEITHVLERDHSEDSEIIHVTVQLQESATNINRIQPEDRGIPLDRALPEDGCILLDRVLPEGGGILLDRALLEDGEILLDRALPEGGEILLDRAQLEEGGILLDRALPEDRGIFLDRALPEDRQILQDRALPEDDGIFLDRALPEDGGIHLDRALPEDGGINLDRAQPEDGGINLDRALPEDGGINLDRAQPDDGGILLDRALPKDRQILLDRSQPEDGGILLDRALPEDGGILLDRALPEDGGIPLDRALPEDGGIPLDRALPEDGGIPLDRALPEDGGISLDRDLPEDGGIPLDRDLTKYRGIPLDRALPEDGEILLDRALPEDGGILLDRALPEDGGISIDRALPEDGGILLDRALPEDRGILLDRALPENGGIILDRALPEDGGIFLDRDLPKDSCILLDRALPENGGIILDRALPKDRQILLDRPQPEDGGILLNRVLPEDGGILLDTALPEDGGIPIDRALQEDGGILLDRALPEDGGIPIDRALPEDGGILLDRALPEDGVIQRDRDLSDTGGIVLDTTLPEDRGILLDRGLPKDGGIPLDMDLPEDGGIPLDRNLPKDSCILLDRALPEDGGIFLDRAQPEDGGILLDRALPENGGIILDRALPEDGGILLDRDLSENGGIFLVRALPEDRGILLDRALTEDGGILLDKALPKDGGILLDRALPEDGGIFLGRALPEDGWSSPEKMQLEEPEMGPDRKSSTEMMQLEEPEMGPDRKSSMEVMQLEEPEMGPDRKSSMEVMQLEEPEMGPDRKSSIEMMQLVEPEMGPDRKSSIEMMQLEEPEMGPDRKSSTEMMQLEEPEMGPDRKSSTKMMQLEEPEMGPDRKSSTEMMQLEEPEMGPDRKSSMEVMQLEEPEMGPDRKSSMEVMQLEEPEMGPDRKSSIEMMQLEEPEIGPDRKSSTKMMQLVEPEMGPDRKSSIEMMQLEEPEMGPDRKSSTEMMQLEEPEMGPDRKSSTKMMQLEEPEMGPDRKSSIEMMQLEEPELGPDRTSSTEMMQLEEPEMGPDRKSSIEMMQLEEPEMGPDRKSSVEMMQLEEPEMGPDRKSSTEMMQLEEPEMGPDRKSSVEMMQLEEPEMGPDRKSSIEMMQLEEPEMGPDRKSSIEMMQLEEPEMGPDRKSSIEMMQLEEPEMGPDRKSSTEMMQLEEPEMGPDRKSSTKMMQLEEPDMGPDRKSSMEMQISPDRKPSEDFSADIKAELEDSPEYQLFRQTSFIGDDNHPQAEAAEEELPADHTNDTPNFMFSLCMREDMRDELFTKAENLVGNESPVSLKHEGAAVSPGTSLGTRTPHSSTGESEKHEGLADTPQMSPLTFPTQEIDLPTVYKETERMDGMKVRGDVIHGDEEILPETEDLVVETKSATPSPVREPLLQEVTVQRKTSPRPVKVVRDMSGMESLLKGDMDHYLEQRPSPVCGAEVMTVQEPLLQEVRMERKTSPRLVTVVSDMSGMESLLRGDMDHYLEKRCMVNSGSPKDDIDQQQSFKQTILARDDKQQSLIFSTKEVDMSTEDTETEKEDWWKVQDMDDGGSRGAESIILNPVQEPMLQEVMIERKTSPRPAVGVKDTLGMEALLSGDLEQYLEDRPVDLSGVPEDDIVQERFEQVVITRERKQETHTFSTEQVDRSAADKVTERDVVNVVQVGAAEDGVIYGEKDFVQSCSAGGEASESSATTVIRSRDSKKVTFDLQRTFDSALPAQASEEDDQVPVETRPILEDWDDLEIKPSYHKSTELSYSNPYMHDSISADRIAPESSWVVPECHERDSADHGAGHSPDGVGQALRPADLEVLFPLALGHPERRLSHGDSLETSPVMDEGSSRKSPDSIEPSSTGDSPCLDSLESSPTELKLDTGFQATKKTAVYEDYYSQLRACLGEEHVSNIENEDYSKRTYQMDGEREGPVPLKGEDPEWLSMPINLSSNPEDDMDDVDAEGSETGQRQFTPEEEMFKMAAKIKTFEEMEQDVKTKTDGKPSDGSVLSDSEDYEECQSIVDLMDREAKSSKPKTDAGTLQSEIETVAEIQPSVPGAVTALDSSVHCEAHLPYSASGHSPSGKQVSEHLEYRSLSTEKEQYTTENISENISERTEQKEKIDVISAMQAHKEEMDQSQLSVSQSGESQSVKPEVLCTDDESFKEVKDADGKAAVLEMHPEDMPVQGELVPWSAMSDDNEDDNDDEAFAARVEAEEQRIMGLMEDRRTPDTTPGRTPTEGGTPNPFQFQEGKFFEMTRGGAIDMTRRSVEEEGEGYAFFHIGEHPVDQVLFEDTGDCASPDVLRTEQNIAIGDLQLQKVDQTKDDSDSSFQTIPLPEADQRGKPVAKLSTSIKMEPKAETFPLLEAKMGSFLEVDSPDPTIAELQMLTTTTLVTRSVYSEQVRQSSDSSLEDEEEEEEEQGSVIEMPAGYYDSVAPPSVLQGYDTSTGSDTSMAPPSVLQGYDTSAGSDTSVAPPSVLQGYDTSSGSNTSVAPTSVLAGSGTSSVLEGSDISVAPPSVLAGSDTSSVLEGFDISVAPSSVLAMSYTSADTAAKDESSFKSKIPIKAGSMKSDLGLEQKSTVEESLVQDRRTRSEEDFGAGKKILTDKDSRSHSDSDHPATKSKPLTSRLPVMSKHKPTAHSSSSSQPDRDQGSDVREPSLRSSLDVDDISSSGDHNSPDSVIFKYDRPTPRRSAPDTRALSTQTRVRASSVTGEVFESRPIWEDSVETQMQRIWDDRTMERQQVDWHDDADRKEETLAIIADLLGFSWTELARELEFNEDEIQEVRTENPNSLQEQSHALLQRWAEREGKHATAEDSLIKRLTKINRMDIVHLIETQMNKSAQEQTSRTYAEIEKTLDQSEVSVALSSVQEDVDSLRLVRRVDSSPRPPPAVSEEDLSVASLLDIPSWAEPMGHTHSESMHGLLEDLEITTELSPNPWTLEDTVTRESTTNSEQVSAGSSNKTLKSETQSGTPDLQIPNAFVFSPLSPEMTMPTEKMRVSPESPEKPLNLNKESSSSETSPVLPDLFSHNAEDSQGDEAQSSASNLEAPPESGAPTQLDQLLSEFEEIKREFRPETLEPLDSPLSETSEGGLEDLQPYVEIEELLPESDGYPTEGEEEISSPSPSCPIQITWEPAEISVVASVPTDLSLSYETDPEVFGVTADLIKTFPEPSQVTADPVQLSHLEYQQTHRAEKSDLTGSIPLDSPTAATKSVGTPESPEPCHKVLDLSSESIVPSQKFQSLEHEDAAVFTEPSTVEEHRISLPQQDQETVGEEYDNSKETSSIQAAVKKASFEQSKVLCESEGLITEPSQLVDETCTSTTPEVVSHLRDSTPPETLEYDEQSPQSLSDVTPLTPETVTAYRSHLRDSTPPETLEYDEQSPQSLSDVTPLTPETVTAYRSHLRDSTPPETLEYDEQSPQSLSDVTPQTTETVTAYRSHLRDSTPPETLEYDEQSHHSLSDVTPQTPETVTVSRHFSFEELIPYQSPRYLNMLSEELRPNTSEQPSDNPVTPIEEEFSSPVTPVEVKSHVSQPGPVDPMAEMVSAQPGPVDPMAEMVSAQPDPVEPRAEMVSAQPVPEVTASAHDEEFFMEFSLPPEYAEASSSIHKPNPPAYAEIIRGSTTMHLYEDTDPETYFDCKQGVSDFSEMEPDELKKRESSGVGQTQGQASHSGALGRKYQKPTALLVCSAVRKHERGVLLSSGSEDYDDAPYDDIKEENEELAQSPGTHRDDSAFYQAPQELPPLRSADDDDSLDMQGEMTDIPPQTVTEEQYTDQHGHTVVRKVKFSERDSDSAWGEEESAEGHEVSLVERNAVVGDETQHGDPTLTSDLPTARDDFTQGQDV